MCNDNPANKRACHDCIHLKETTVSYQLTDYEGSLTGQSLKAKAFRCDKLDKMIYPFKVEKKDLVNKYPETFDGQEPMPKKCELFQLNY